MGTMRRITVVMSLAAVMLAAPGTPTRAWAQPASPRPELAAPGAGVQPPLTPPAPPSVAGRVQQYLLTPHGEVDGLLLADSTVVKFPPTYTRLPFTSSVRTDRFATGFHGESVWLARM